MDFLGKRIPCPPSLSKVEDLKHGQLLKTWFHTSIIVPMPAGINTSILVFSSRRYRKMIPVETHLQITAEESKVYWPMRI